MVSLKVLFYTLIVDANEGRDVANFDVPGSYLHADIPKDKRILMKLRFFFKSCVRSTQIISSI